MVISLKEWHISTIQLHFIFNIIDVVDGYTLTRESNIDMSSRYVGEANR